MEVREKEEQTAEIDFLNPEQFDEYSAILEHIIDQKKWSELPVFFGNHHPADLAQMIGVLPKSDALKVIPFLKRASKLADTLVELPENYIEDIVGELPERSLVEIVEELDPDDAVDFLQFMEDEQQESILSLLHPNKVKEVKKLLRYEEDTAGALMDPRFFSLLDTFTIEEAIQTVRAGKERLENIYFLFVVGRKRKLVGTIEATQLLLNPPRNFVSSIMTKDIQSVRTNTSTDDVASLFAKYDLPSVAVVNSENKLVGRITVDDVIDVIEEKSTKEVYGLSDLNENDRVFSSPLSSSKLRLPWLIFHFFASLMASFVISQFEGTLEAAVVLAGLMPIVAGMGGNAGSQTLTVIIRGLALGELQTANKRRAVYKESMVGALSGLAVGLVSVLTIGIWKGSWALGGVLALALFLNLCFATLLGSIIPVVLKKLNIDPALASTTLLTMFTDAFGFLIFLSLAKFFMSYISFAA